ncbi:hypothetical protein TWF191_006551 [Orbilia oligospora]|uniref:Uncharacterized protein n=1 Tax=Orbilia oligospora TaxID=2813651 RepID=A0A7C8QQH9_ORBOL|nr:hypothetical protein TWF679_009378 [Orbilia oligospora]KAF3223271.1 hypothetical protein TWF191_006551 [Orbilia oligospora]
MTKMSPAMSISSRILFHLCRSKDTLTIRGPIKEKCVGQKQNLSVNSNLDLFQTGYRNNGSCEG